MAKTEKQVITVASDELLHRLPQPDWATYYHAIFGCGGVLETVFGDPAARAAFERTDLHAELLAKVNILRENSKSRYSDETTMITVRLPKSMHEALVAESHRRQQSLNQLCIAKLLQPVVTASTKQNQ